MAILVQEVNGLIEDSQRTTAPVCPAKVNKPLVVPEQIPVPPVTSPPIETAFTVTVIPFEVAGEPETQVILEVITRVTVSSFDKVVVVKVAAVSPDTFVSFIFH